MHRADRSRVAGGLPGLKMLVATVLVSIAVSGAANAEDERCQPTPGPVVAANSQPCVPTPEECATGNYNGVYNDGGLESGRFAVCIAAEGHVITYVGGSLLAVCGAVYVADQLTPVYSNPEHAEDPNSCP